MDFRTLQYFTVVAQELNFTRAAEKLNMSQPPLSNQIKGLEEDLGVQLFIRGKRHLQLTEAGSLLLHRSNQMLALADKTRSDLAHMESGLSGSISLGMVEGRAPYIASRWIAGFREEYPMVTYQMWNGSSDDVLEHLARGLSDLAVIAYPFDNEHLDSIVVGREPWIAIIPKNHPLSEAPGDTVKLEELARYPLVIPRRNSRIEAIRKWFAGIGKEPNVVCEMSNYLDAVALTEQNVGISIFPQTTYTPNPLVTSKVITDPAKYVEYELVWPKDARPGVLVQEFINYVRDFMEEDMMHTGKYAVKEQEFSIPEGADIL
ncbi:MAG: LysR family transcriptional regulator [Lachnospiraceae bacterium]|jgi:DNA-binding transcriptional LysR family regulator|nr:LysR family transcriptional regulator [Lachnospiraceae bacterium]